MHDDQNEATAERRVTDREPLHGEVMVDLDAAELFGTGQNVSATGVYMVTDRAPRLHVRLPGEGRVREAELVRLDTLAPGKIGYAIRFLRDSDEA